MKHISECFYREEKGRVIFMKKLGFGLMRLPQLDKDDYGSVDIERVKKMADAFMENGFTLILSILVDTFSSRISMSMPQHPESRSISGA